MIPPLVPNASLLPDPDRHGAFYAGTAPRRALAWVIDTVLTAILTALIVPFTAFTALFFLPVLYAAVNAVWRWGFLAGASATPGMWLTGIEFRRHDGQRFDGVTAFLHTAGYVTSWIFVLPQVASVALMATTARGQGLTDIILGTAAINRPGRV
jgi:uncharacterized RDD family membrane protein YckC